MSSSSIVPPANTNSASSAVQNSTNAAAQTALGQLSGNLDTFLKMLMTQLKNQDPTTPLDTAQFTQQLVQYSQVEQQIQSNQALTTIATDLRAAAAASAASYINQSVTINGTTQPLVTNGSITWSYTLPSDANSLQLTVVDSNGKLVTPLSGPSTAGAHTVTWNGLDSNDNPVQPGNYTLKAVAKNVDGAPMTVTENVSGTVTGVSFDTSGNPQVIIGGKAYAAANILSIGSQKGP